jgi:hypothetical protein
VVSQPGGGDERISHALGPPEATRVRAGRAPSGTPD